MNWKNVDENLKIWEEFNFFRYYIWSIIILFSLLSLTFFILQFIHYKENTKSNKLIFIQELSIMLIYNILRGFIFGKDKYLTHQSLLKTFLQYQLSNFYSTFDLQKQFEKWN